MANEMMQQALRGSDYQVPEGAEGYFGPMPKFSLGSYGQPRGPNQPVISPEALQQAMAPPPAPEPEAAPAAPAPGARPPPASVGSGRVREQPWTRSTFDANAYISQYPDLQVEQRKNPKFNAFDHWQRYGQNENRFSGQSPQTSLGGGASQAQAAPPPQAPAPSAQTGGGGGQMGPSITPQITPPTPEQIAQVRGSLGAPPMAPPQPPPPPMPMNPVAPQINQAQLARALREPGSGVMAGRGGGGRGGGKGRGIRRY